MAKNRRRKSTLGAAPALGPCRRGYQIMIKDVNGRPKSKYGCFSSESGAEQVLKNVRSVLKHARRWEIVKV